MPRLSAEFFNFGKEPKPKINAVIKRFTIQANIVGTSTLLGATIGEIKAID